MRVEVWYQLQPLIVSFWFCQCVHPVRIITQTVAAPQNLPSLMSLPTHSTALTACGTTTSGGRERENITRNKCPCGWLSQQPLASLRWIMTNGNSERWRFCNSDDTHQQRRGVADAATALATRQETATISKEKGQWPAANRKRMDTRNGTRLSSLNAVSSAVRCLTNARTAI